MCVCRGVVGSLVRAYRDLVRVLVSAVVGRRLLQLASARIILLLRLQHASACLVILRAYATLALKEAVGDLCSTSYDTRETVLYLELLLYAALSY